MNFERKDGETRLSCELLVPQGLKRVFAFFSSPSNLERITPPFLRFQIVQAPSEIVEGCIIEYKLRLRGFPLRWISRITEWNPPNRFVDEQLRGPYRKWAHEHQFEETDGGTVVRDIVHYRAIGGDVVDRLLIRPDVQRIFAYRVSALQRLFSEENNFA